ncbi:hypothetical protein HELRODRAFT_62327 [Helobdella robusta]|uniref:Protein-tyrosine-phosphatase n=1 Tax=Helobdella robusta TaxID=6412 RepID=T1FWZ5_HELRO|nr:hypothetical protein HELRODRAFT_62327 [Helobdella robusta]ESO12943.1 hypothetical protein HELRODRAFT_62327 [Helobdella robusta]
MNDCGFCIVLDHLYISNIFSVTRPNIEKKNIKLIISLTRDTPTFEFDGVKVLKFEIDDDMSTNIKTLFHQCTDEIKATIDTGGNVLVHCIAGVSRSATICLAYLLKHQHMTLLDAYNHLKKCRPLIRPNSNFFQQLIAFEAELNDGKTTVKMIDGDFGYIPDVYKISSDSYGLLKIVLDIF